MYFRFQYNQRVAGEKYTVRHVSDETGQNKEKEALEIIFLPSKQIVADCEIFLFSPDISQCLMPNIIAII